MSVQIKKFDTKIRKAEKGHVENITIFLVMILLPRKLGCCMSRFGSRRQPWRPTITPRVQRGGISLYVFVFLCVCDRGIGARWRLTQEHVPQPDDQNMPISLRCFNTNPLRGTSETYLYLSLRWRALNRQFISLSHFRLCFLADKWHLLPKPSGWSSLPATIALLGWAPNIHHNTLCLHVCLSDFVRIWFWRELKASEVSGCNSLSLSLPIYLLPGPQTGDRERDSVDDDPRTASSSALMQCSNTTVLSDRMQTRPCSDLLSSVGSCWVTTPEISGGNYKYEAATPFTFWQISRFEANCFH